MISTPISGHTPLMFTLALSPCCDLFDARGESERAARLFAAAEVVREDIDYALPVPDRDEYEGTVAGIRTTIGGMTFAAAWAEGRAMTLEQAIEYALAVETGSGEVT